MKPPELCEVEFRKLIRELYQYRCFMCDGVGTDVHHWAFKRNVLMFKHDPRNALFLCRMDHDDADRDNNKLIEEKLSMTDTGKLMLLWRDKMMPIANTQIGYIEYEKRLATLRRARILNLQNGGGVFNVWLNATSV